MTLPVSFYWKDSLDLNDGWLQSKLLSTDPSYGFFSITVQGSTLESLNEEKERVVTNLWYALENRLV